MTEAKSLQEVMQEHSQLCSLGYRSGWLADELANLSRWRVDLAADVEQFEKVRAWVVENLRQRKTINTGYNSYTLKHICEQCTGYVMNGTFIAAMIANGYKVRTIFGSPYPCFNVTTTSIERAFRADWQGETP